MLPLEIVDDICQRLAREDLVSVLQANRALQTLCTRLVYEHIPILPLPRCVWCLRVLSTNHTLCSHVRSLEIDWRDASPATNLYHLLHRVLQRLPSLTALSLELPAPHTPYWLLSLPNFTLSAFTTSLPCTQPLAAFLASQPSITALTLRAPLQLPHPFVLHPTTLPNLSHFRTIYDRPALIAAVVAGRPVHMASIPLFASLTTQALQALRTSAAPIKRLSLMSFDPAADPRLLAAVVTLFPELEALHVVVLLTQYSNNLLRASGSCLAGFKSLRYLTFMAPMDEHSEDDEQAIAMLWHRYCPTLSTIILPRGRVWFEDTSSQWTLLHV